MAGPLDTDQAIDLFALEDEPEKEKSEPESDPTTPIPKVLHPRALLASLLAGGVTGISSVTGVVALASLIYSGDLAGSLSAGVGLMLIGTLVVSAVAGLTSSIPGVIAGLQDTGIAVLALVSASIVAAMPPETPLQATFITVVAAIMGASILTGLLFLLVGMLQLGDLIRYIPFPVIGGFLGGTGMSLVRGGLTVMAPASLIEAITHPIILGRWLPALAFAIALVVVMRRSNHFLILPGMLLGGAGLFFVILWLTDTPIATAVSQGWLIEPMQSGGLWQPVPLAAYRMIQWPVLFAQLGSILSVSVIMLITLLLNASGIELETQREMKLDQELKSMGVANILAGFVGSPPGAHYLGSTLVTYHMGASSRLSGLFNAAVSAIVLTVGGALINFVPTPILSGLLIFFGLSFLLTWVYETWDELPKGEYAIILLILGVIFFRGFLEGVALGVIVSVILFVINYSQINVIKHELSGANHSSTVERPALYRKLLFRKGHWLYMLKLQGFIFFGTANTLYKQFRARVEAPDMPRPRYFLLDFHNVTGVDTSALISFQRMLQFAKQNGIVLIFCDLPQKMRPRMEHGVFEADRDKHWVAYSTLDRGMEWYENRVIAEFESVGLAIKPPTMTTQLKQVLPDQASVERLTTYFEQRELGPGSILVQEGNPPVGIYFVEKGQVRVELHIDDDRSIRLRTMGSGTVVGELSTYLDVPATASVITETETVLFFLSTESLLEMEKESPELSTAFHRFMAHAIAERLASAAETMKVLLG